MRTASPKRKVTFSVSVGVVAVVKMVSVSFWPLLTMTLGVVAVVKIVAVVM